MEKSRDVLCVGLIVADILLNPVDESIFDVDSTKLEHIPLMTGGDAANQASALVGLGFSAALAAKIGADTFGDAVAQQMKNRGVDVSCVKKDDATVTSTSVVLINKNGQRNFVYCAGNNDSLTVEDIDGGMIESSKILALGSMFGLRGLDGDGTARLFEKAKAAGVITVADTTHDIYNIGFEGILPALKSTDYFVPSFVEAKYITGEREPKKIAEKLMRFGVKNVFIKLGSQGCYVLNNHEGRQIAAYDVEVVDTTGCGDNFTAGLIGGILKGWDAVQCGEFANATGSMNAMQLGACSKGCTMDEVLAFMETTPKCKN